MSTIVTRTGKGSALTYAELDANFTNLNADKLEASALSPYLLTATAASAYATIDGGVAMTNKTLTNPVINGFTGGTGAIVIGGNQLVKDTAGNFGVGVTPLVGGGKVQLGNGQNFSFQGTFGNLNTNLTYTDNWRYITSAGAAAYYQNEGGHYWQSAAPGTAGALASMSALMSLDVNGKLCVGAIGAAQRLNVAGGVYIGGAATLGVTGTPGTISFEYPYTRHYIGDGSGYAWALTKRSGSINTDILTVYESSNSIVVKGDISSSGGAFRQSYGPSGVPTNFAAGDLALNNSGNTGVALTAIGYGALYANTTGGYQTAVGYLALTANTTGVRNTAIGYTGLQSNTTGSYNTTAGYAALSANTTGGSNSAFGYGTLSNNTTGSSSSAFGFQALNANTSGYANSAFGNSALQSNTSGSYNTAVGLNSLVTNSTGTRNTAIGPSAGANLTTGSFNTFIGSGVASNSAITGSDNIAIGAWHDGYYESPMAYLTSGAVNIAIGNSALRQLTTGNYNVAIGHRALDAADTNGQSTAVGYSALSANKGEYNTAVGSQSLQTNTTGHSNTGVGQFSMQANSTGIQNTAVGKGAMQLNSTGNLNVAIGYAALYTDGNALQCTAVGAFALQQSTGPYNTAVGYYAMGATTTGSYSTALGYDAMSGNTIYGNCSAIGYNSQVTGGNQVQLGDANTTTYVYGTVQNRSDLRDKTDVQDTTLGLNFIKCLRPVDYRWDMREDYKPQMPDVLPPVAPATPTAPSMTAPKEGIERYEEELAGYNSAQAKYQEELAAHDAALVAYEAEKAEYDKVISEWREACKLSNIKRDGSKKRNRLHHGFIAQEVMALNAGFGGIQDHGIKGGDDVLSIGYDEMVAPLVKAVQEQQALIESLMARVTSLELH